MLCTRGDQCPSRYHPASRRNLKAPPPQGPPPTARPVRRSYREPAGQAYSGPLQRRPFGWRLRGDIQQRRTRGSHRPPDAVPRTGCLFVPFSVLARKLLVHAAKHKKKQAPAPPVAEVRFALAANVPSPECNSAPLPGQNQALTCSVALRAAGNHARRQQQ